MRWGNFNRIDESMEWPWRVGIMILVIATFILTCQMISPEFSLVRRIPSWLTYSAGLYSISVVVCLLFYAIVADRYDEFWFSIMRMSIALLVFGLGFWLFDFLNNKKFEPDPSDFCLLYFPILLGATTAAAVALWHSPCDFKHSDRIIFVGFRLVLLVIILWVQYYILHAFIQGLDDCIDLLGLNHIHDLHNVLAGIFTALTIPTWGSFIQEKFNGFSSLMLMTRETDKEFLHKLDQSKNSVRQFYNPRYQGDKTSKPAYTKWNEGLEVLEVLQYGKMFGIMIFGILATSLITVPTTGKKLSLDMSSDLITYEDWSSFQANVFFEEDSTNFDHGEYEKQWDAIDRLLRSSMACIQKQIDTLELRVTGYASDRGPSDTNLTLANQRAKNVGAAIESRALALYPIKGRQVKTVARRWKNFAEMYRSPRRIREQGKNKEDITNPSELFNRRADISFVRIGSCTS